MNSTSMCVRLIFFFGCGYMFRFSDCLTIGAHYGQSKSDVEFTCVINPYTNNQKWLVNDVQVAACAAISCSNEPTNPTRYFFTPNITTGTFIFKIDSINSTDDKSKVTCHDGTNNKSLYIDLSVRHSGPPGGWCSISTNANNCIGLIAGCIIFVLWLIGGIGWCCRRTTTLKQADTCCITALLWIPIVGFITLIVLECKNRCCDKCSNKTGQKTGQKDELLTTLTKRHHERTSGQNCENCLETLETERESHAYCLFHGKYLCLECLYTKHKKKECVQLWHQDKIGPLNTEKQMNCHPKFTTEKPEVVFCIQCKIFIFDLRSNLHDNHIVISSLIDVIDKNEVFCCHLNCKTNVMMTDDFCIRCFKFICASCVKLHNSYMVISALTGLISTRTVMCCTSEENKKTMDFCIQCQTFICGKCEKHHHNHFTVSSLKASTNEIFFKGCPPTTEKIFSIRRVFQYKSYNETWHLEEARTNMFEFQESSVKKDTKNQKLCQVHEGNLFYCNRCPSGKFNPVECCDLTSLEFRCRNCYILNVQSGTKMSYTEEVKSKMHDLRKMDDKCRVHEDDTMSTTAAVVYCLVCKYNMCKSCFNKHINSEINQHKTDVEIGKKRSASNVTSF